MSVSTSSRLNPDQLLAALPAGASISCAGAHFEEAGQKTITSSVDDATLAAAITAAAAQYSDYDVNAKTLRQRTITALAGNQAFLALPDPRPGNQTYLGIANPTNAQVVAQVRALTQQNTQIVAQLVAVTRQINALIRIANGALTDVADS